MKEAKTVLILGATSSISQALAYEFGKLGYHVFLAGRDLVALKALSSDLKIRHGITSQIGYFDANNSLSQNELVNTIAKQITSLVGIVIACGYGGNQRLAESDANERESILASNLLAPIHLIECARTLFDRDNENFIIALSSVAGDRGRQSNYFYGASKAGFTAYLQGLRNRLSRENIPVLTVKLGFVDTKMTFGRSDLFAVASPSSIAKKIIAAWKKRKNSVYLPAWWGIIMTIVCLIPERYFKKMLM